MVAGPIPEDFLTAVRRLSSCTSGASVEEPIEARARRGSSDSGKRVEAMCSGVSAVVTAMSGEVQFLNDNEQAFALFRRGCRYCSDLHDALEDVEPKDVIIAFLARVALRKGAARQLRELCGILVKVHVWRDELLKGPQQLVEVLSADASILAAFAGASPELRAAVAQQSGAGAAPGHGARIFLREALSGRFLTVTERREREHDAPTFECIMTERPVSLFVCFEADEVEECDATDFKGSCRGGSIDGLVLGFAHEGLPALGCFLGTARARRRDSLRTAMFGAKPPELRCDSLSLEDKGQWQWMTDGTVQHVGTRWWLHVDPKNPGVAIMQDSGQSRWEALRAL